MKSWGSLRIIEPKKGIRGAIARLISWAFREELDELRQHDETLYRFFDGYEDINKRFDKDQDRMKAQHADWKAANERQQITWDDHRKVIEKSVDDQNAILGRIEKLLGEKL